MSTHASITMPKENEVPAEHDTSHEIYKLSNNTSFGRRLRSLSTRRDTALSAGNEFESPYRITSGPHAEKNGDANWTFVLQNRLYEHVQFELRVDIISGGIVRIRVDEPDSKTGLKRYNGAAGFALDGVPALEKTSAIAVTSTDHGTEFKFPSLETSVTLTITHSPFKIDLKNGDKPAVVFNERSLFHLEHFRGKEEDANTEEKRWFVGERDGEEWEESYREYTEVNTKGKYLEGISVFPSQIAH